jgi:GNAT superfamily N-acetyltransferase
MADCTVTDASTDDVPAMVELLRILFAQERDFQPRFHLQTAALNALQSRSDIGRLFVARRESNVVGMVSLLFTISTATGGKVAWLEDLVVMPNVRGEGIGTQLLQHVIGWARRHDIKRITLLTDSDNEGAQHLYLSQGFTASRMVPLRLHLG